MRGPSSARGNRDEDKCVSPAPVRQTKDIIATTKASTDHATQSSELQIHENERYLTSVRVRHTSAQGDVQYMECNMLRMLSKRTINIIPNERFISALSREHNAAMQVKGSLFGSWIWNSSASQSQWPSPEHKSKSDNTLSVFHSLTSEATKLSHESLNLAKASEKFGGTQSSGNGKRAPVVRYGAVSVPAASHASMIRCSSGRDTAAS